MASYVDNVSFDIPENFRQINESMLKVFVKQVYVKSQLQGHHFKYYEAVDLDLFGITHFPEFIKQQAQDRKLFLVETKDLWFLLSPPEGDSGNAFSIYRFLYEEQVGGGLFLTGVGLPKKLVNDPTAQKFFLNRVGRIFSLDKNIDMEIKKYVLLLKKVINEQLEPLLLNKNFGIGGNTEQLVAKRTTRFEEILSSTVLQKLPSILLFAQNSQADRDFLLQGLSQFFDGLLRLIDKFRLHPFARQSFVAKNLYIKVIAMNTLIQKNQSWIFYHEIDDMEAYGDFKKAMPALKECYNNALDEDDELNDLISTTKAKYNKYEQGGFLAKLFGKPKYTLDELRQAKQDLGEQFFVDVMRIAKNYKKSVIFVEHETNLGADEHYRHYAIAHEKYHLTRLPYVIGLPEDRGVFTLSMLEEDINWQIFARVDNV